MSDLIRLRVFGFSRKGQYYLLCLDTDIAVRADSLEEAKKKMIDALGSYLETFSQKEISQARYVRYSPIRYRIAWYLGMAAGFMRQLVQSLNASYNPNSGQLRFA